MTFVLIPLTPSACASGRRGENLKTVSKPVSLGQLTIDDDGMFGFWHDDGDLFFGHFIWVMGILQEGLIRADIPG